MTSNDNHQRCDWVNQDPLYIAYHDQEWGRPQYDDAVLFEFLLLESLQAGLSWLTVLKKRQAYRQVFKDFNPQIIEHKVQHQLDDLMSDARLIRNRRKFAAMATNALAYQRVCDQYNGWSSWLWQTVDHQPVTNHWQDAQAVPTTTPAAQQLCRQLKSAGFVFVGPTICYAFMQAVGMVNDHTAQCYLVP